MSLDLEVLLKAAQYVQDYNLTSSSSNHHNDVEAGSSHQPSSNGNSSTSTTTKSPRRSKGSSLDRGVSSSTVSKDGSFRSDCYLQVEEEGSSSMLVDSDTLSEDSEELPSDCRKKAPGQASRKSSPSGSCKGKDKTRRSSVKHNTENRSVHNVLEKNRRAHLKDCFDSLKQEVLDIEDDKKASHLAVLKSAVKCIQHLKRQGEQLQIDTDMLTKERNSVRQRLHELKQELLRHNPAFDVVSYLSNDADDADSQATCTAPGSTTSHRDIPSPEGLLPPVRGPGCALDHNGISLSSLNLNPADSSTFTTISPAIATTQRRITDKRKKSVGEDYRITGDPPTKTRKPPLKSVTQILQETSPEPSGSSNSSLALSSATVSAPQSATPESSSADKQRLPIRFRILQDHQKGMFVQDTESPKSPPSSGYASAPSITVTPTKVEEEEELTSETQLVVRTHPYSDMQVPVMSGGFWSAGDRLTAFPFYGASGSGFGMPFFAGNQFFVPVSAVQGGGSMLMGQLPQIVMVPASAGLNGTSHLYQHHPQPGPSSSPQ